MRRLSINGNPSGEPSTFPVERGRTIGFDLNNAVNDNVDKAKDTVNDKAGKEVVNDDHAQQAKDTVNDAAGKLGERFGK